MGKPIIKILPEMIVNKGKKRRLVLLVGDDGSVAASGTLVSENRRPLSSGTWKAMPLAWCLCYPSPTLELWTTGVYLLMSLEVWGELEGGHAEATHLSLFKSVLPACVLHFRLRMCTRLNSSELVVLFLSLCLWNKKSLTQDEGVSHRSKPTTWKTGSAACWRIAWRQMP